MDDRHFQQELHALQQRMATLSPSVSPKVTSGDPFVHQLADLEALLALMQQRLARYEATMAQREHATVTISPCTMHSSHPCTQDVSRMPPAPCFWEMFNALRSEMAALNARLVTAEAGVSEVEDRIDALDPSRFTPPGTTDGNEGPAETSLCQPFVPASCTAAVSELHSDAAAAFQTHAPLDHWSQQASPKPLVFSPSHQAQSQEYNATRTTEPNPDLGSLSSPPRFTHRYPRNPENSEPDYRKCEPHLDSGHSTLHTWDTFGPHVRGPRHGESRLELGNMASPDHLHVLPDGLAFRDREVSRMDEQLRRSQEAVRAGEVAIAQYKLQCDGLQREKQEANDTSRHWALSNDDLHRQLSNAQGRLRAQDKQIYDLQDQLAQQDDTIRSWEANCDRLQEVYDHFSAQVWASERELREEHDRKDYEIERILYDHDIKLRRLQDFCEEKGAVIREQERVISRGARLLEERDREIEELQRTVRYGEAAHEVQAPNDSGEGKSDRSRHHRDNCGIGLSFDTGRVEEPRSPWNLRETSSTGADVETGPSATKGGFGDGCVRPLALGDNASVASYHSDEAERHYPTSESEQGSSMYSPLLPYQKGKQTRNDAPRRPIPLPWYPQQNVIRYDAGNMQDSRSVDQVARSNERRGNARQHPADATYSPPAARVAPMEYRRLASESNLRSSEANAARRLPVKHYSTQGLRRRRWQAHVESDNENAGGLGGAV